MLGFPLGCINLNDPPALKVQQSRTNRPTMLWTKKTDWCETVFCWRVKMWVNKTTTLEECLSINILYLYIVISFSFSVSNIASQCKCGWSKIVRKFQWYTRSNYLEWLLTLSQMYTLNIFESSHLVGKYNLHSFGLPLCLLKPSVQANNVIWKIDRTGFH